MNSIRLILRWWPISFPRTGISKSSGNQRASIITSIAMFYDLEDPGAFVQDIARSLEPDWHLAL